MHRLKDAVTTLANALGHVLGIQELTAVDEAIEDFDLSDHEVVPVWILELLDAWSAGRITDDWVPFELIGMEASDTLQFLRELPTWLPVNVDDQGERWTLTSPRLPNEAIIAFEGDFYLVKPVGTPAPGQGNSTPDKSPVHGN